jgi:hypothetical protein
MPMTRGRPPRLDSRTCRDMYINGASMQEIAERWGCSRVAVWKALKRLGFNAKTVTVPLLCSECGQTYQASRREAKRVCRHLCSPACRYTANHATPKDRAPRPEPIESLEALGLEQYA